MGTKTRVGNNACALFIYFFLSISGGRDITYNVVIGT